MEKENNILAFWEKREKILKKLLGMNSAIEKMIEENNLDELERVIIQRDKTLETLFNFKKEIIPSTQNSSEISFQMEEQKNLWGKFLKKSAEIEKKMELQIHNLKKKSQSLAKMEKFITAYGIKSQNLD